MSTVERGPFVGINNRLPDHQLEVVERGRKVGDYLRNAVNVDITDAGTLRRRAGTARVVEGSDVHSLWAEDDDGYYVDGGTLYAFPRRPIRTGMPLHRAASFTKTPVGVVWTNGVTLERITGDASVPLGLAIPNPAPRVVGQGGGSLPAGLYRVAITAIGPSGEESGATWPVQVQVPANGRIAISRLPGTPVCIYASPQNGETLYRVVATSDLRYSIVGAVPLIVPIATVGLRPMPAGQIVRCFNGRLLVAVGDTLHISEPFAYGLQDPLKGFVQFQGRITVVEPVDAGVFVCADKTYFLEGGNPADAAALREVLPYGGVEGTGGRNKQSKDVFWFSERGLVIGDERGQAKNVQEQAVAVGRAASGAQLYRDQNGVRQIVSSLFGAEASTAAATSYMEAEIIRKEVMR